MNYWRIFTSKEVLGALFTVALIVVPLLVSAQQGSGGGAPFGSGGGPPQAGTVSIENPLKFNSICGLIKGLLDAAIVIGIPIAVLFIVYAGLKYVLARGNATDLAKAHTNLLYTIIGIGIFLGSWVIIEVIVNTVKALGVPGVGACN